MVRTRIPPSPTGDDLHIGNLYTALINWAWAKKNRGKFIVRIEDTDRERLIPGAAEKILQTLRDYGLEPDEDLIKGGPYGPYVQSQRLDLYQKYAHQLVQQGHAYYCFCTKERLAKLREEAQKQKKQPKYDRHCLKQGTWNRKHGTLKPQVIRLKVPDNKQIVFEDLIRGKVVINSNTIDDQVLLKSDGYPTYHLAVVVDDYLMKISHVIRAEEWMSSVPKHIIIYKALGWELPIFAHVPLLRTPDRGKISKRKGAVWASWYLDEGYLKEAVLNYIALMAWSHPEQKEIFSLEEYINVFDLKDINPVAPIFDVQKLTWMNGEYIRAMEGRNLKFKIFNFYSGKYSEELIEKTIPLVQERIKTLKEYDEYCRFFIERPKKYSPVGALAAVGDIDLSSYVQMFKHLYIRLYDIDEKQWSAEKIGEVMQSVAMELDIKSSEFFMAVRVAIAGKKITPPLNESMEILGKKECLSRIKVL